MGELAEKSFADIVKVFESTLPTKENIVREATALTSINTRFLDSRYEDVISAAFTAFNLDKEIL